MRHIILGLFSMLLILFSSCNTQRDPYLYEIIGLPTGDKFMEYIILGAPLLLLGVIVYYIDKHSKRKVKKEDSSEMSKIGCIGVVIALVGGLIFLLPIIAWFELIVNIIIAYWYVAVAGFLILSVLVYLIIAGIEKIKKK